MNNKVVYASGPYIVLVGKYPEGDDYPNVDCYQVTNKTTSVVEFYCNSLPKAIYLAQESEAALDKLMKNERLSGAQLELVAEMDLLH